MVIWSHCAEFGPDGVAVADPDEYECDRTSVLDFVASEVVSNEKAVSEIEK